MSLEPGTRIGRYTIGRPLGAGGMAVVYAGIDTETGSDVAVKVLPEELVRDTERYTRFQREARALASMNHPNVARLHRVEDGAIVMELVPGTTLAERLKSGPIPVEEATDIARQIALGIEEAHERGVVHRDLKPANVMITPEGVVKLLDFGLAKIVEPRFGDSSSATLAISTTQLGTLVGTPWYMSPEQARGEQVDRRADIWAFGVLLYQMVTGVQPFGGRSVADTLAAIVREEPDLTKLPPQLRGVVRRCLVKEPMHRLRDIGDARLLLNDPESAVAPRSRATRALTMACLILSFALVALTLALNMQPRGEVAPVMAFMEGNATETTISSGRGAVLSNDGMRLVFVARGTDGARRLVTRRLDQTAVQTLAGTEGAMYPFFSPDGGYIGFFSGGKLKKVPADGGAVVALCDAPNGRGGAWAPGDYIVAALSNRGPLMRVPAAGGAPAPLTHIDASRQENSHRWPHLIIEDNVLLYTAGTAGGGSYLTTRIDATSLVTGTTKTLRKGGTFARYVPPGFLTWLQDGTMFASRFDARKLEFSGQTLPVVDHVLFSESTGEGLVGLSPRGTLVYSEGREAAPTLALQWVDRSGRSADVFEQVGVLSSPRISPDRSRLAVVITESGNSDIWIFDIAAGKMTRLTFSGGVEESPTWTLDSKGLVFRSDKGIELVSADGSGTPRTLVSGTTSLYPVSFTPDGKSLLYEELNVGTGIDLSMVESNGGTPRRLLATPRNDAQPAVSSDGKWLAYSSDETGRSEVYVRPFTEPLPETRWQISSAGGNYPVWSRNSSELMYRAYDERIMIVPYRATETLFGAGKERRWSELPHWALGFSRPYDVASDGSRLLVLSGRGGSASMPPAAPLTVILNFHRELDRRLPKVR